MKVPFLDLKTPHQELEADLEAAFKRVLNSGWYILGKEVETFEAEFAEYCSVAHCVGIGNGLDAIHLLLLAYGIGQGDEVIVPANTFIATWLAVTYCGATPVPVEPDSATYNIDPLAIESAITARTAAIIPVHLYGQPADMDAINLIAQKHGLVVIEDAAQAQGARYRGHSACSLGNAATTSFYPAKNLGALGDGGAVLTNDNAVADKVRQLRNYGSKVKYQHDLLGYNSRLDELQAAFLTIKLRRLNAWNERRAEIADYYADKLAGCGIKLPYVPLWANPVWHLYVVQAEKRDELQNFLHQRDIETMIHYPVPPHMQECYTSSTYQGLPVTERLSRQILSLPIYHSMTLSQADVVIDAVRSYFQS
ncbi:DegT/DnrJ/EryC1/StrS family aminotransferase [Nitrosovibrio tenuis]|uniref:dTDP-4-amino-4,6-dideoxygalactose transaminase n=1 Tax=Nitrosovibrio tenuis TaxID=1233 RepID=A0A1H7GCR4_9PROT|nr:DegT/DnrJ/EryC1/StrS family aminotransferase [Nitrosovibrio tenuis]SEK35898.1 dTDP-4-amino-4,6-dideoxygalactose transaminase [Nitrosovibrio tenuis]